MYLPCVQNPIATTAPQAPVWSCAMALEGKIGSDLETVRLVSKQFAHRGSFSLLCTRSFGSLNARRGNPEDTN